MTRTIGAMTVALALAVGIVLAWYLLALAVHAAPTSCGRACLDPGVTENPLITLIGG